MCWLCSNFCLSKEKFRPYSRHSSFFNSIVVIDQMNRKLQKSSRPTRITTWLDRGSEGTKPTPGCIASPIIIFKRHLEHVISQIPSEGVQNPRIVNKKWYVNFSMSGSYWSTKHTQAVRCRATPQLWYCRVLLVWTLHGCYPKPTQLLNQSQNYIRLTYIHG